MSVLAVVIEGVWVPVDEDGRPVVNPKPDTRVTPTSTMEQIVANFAQIVCLAQDLPGEDQRRVRDFARAALATLEATTSLKSDDQKMFDRALRGGSDDAA